MNIPGANTFWAEELLVKRHYVLGYLTYQKTSMEDRVAEAV